MSDGPKERGSEYVRIYGKEGQREGRVGYRDAPTFEKTNVNWYIKLFYICNFFDFLVSEEFCPHN